MEKEQKKIENSLSKRQLRKMKKEAKTTDTIKLVTEEEKLNKEMKDALKSHREENCVQITSSLPAAQKDSRLYLVSQLAKPIKGLGVQAKTLFKQRKDIRSKMWKKRLLDAERFTNDDYDEYIKKEDGSTEK